MSDLQLLQFQTLPTGQEPRSGGLYLEQLYNFYKHLFLVMLAKYKSIANVGHDSKHFENP